MFFSPKSGLRLSALLALPAAISAAVNFDCSDIVSDGFHFNFKSLGGPRTVTNIVDDDLVRTNQTFSLDLCDFLKKDSKASSNYTCPTSTRVCNIDYHYQKVENRTEVERVAVIAGDFMHSGWGWDPKWSRPSKSGSHSDADLEGLLIEFNGGIHPFKKVKGQDQIKQRAYIQMICDKGRSGLETDEDSEHEERERIKRDDGDSGNNSTDTKGSSLTYVSYKLEGSDGEEKYDTLRLNWRTKYACEDGPGDDDDSDPSKKSSWGFFTWFLIILFMAISAYLIFGSWLNYNRYGARGWDLLPHGDTIRDIPYLVKDWGRRVVSTVQGGGSRGGYSAV